MNRYEAIQAIMECITDELVVCTLGHPSQELCAIKDRPENFYMLGSMGLASYIGLGLAMCTDRKVVVIDGDGAVLMNLGTLATIGAIWPRDYLLIIIDNKVYGSTGNQPTFSSRIQLGVLARACRIPTQVRKDAKGVKQAVRFLLSLKTGPKVLIIKTDTEYAGTNPVPLDPVTMKDRFKEAI